MKVHLLQRYHFLSKTQKEEYLNVDLEYFRKNATGVMTSGNKFLQKPSDWLANFSLSFVNSSSENVFLLQKDVNYLQEFHLIQVAQEHRGSMLLLMLTILLLHQLLIVILLLKCIIIIDQRL